MPSKDQGGEPVRIDLNALGREAEDGGRALTIEHHLRDEADGGEFWTWAFDNEEPTEAHSVVRLPAGNGGEGWWFHPSTLSMIRQWVEQGRSDVWICHQLDTPVPPASPPALVELREWAEGREEEYAERARTGVADHRAWNLGASDMAGFAITEIDRLASALAPTGQTCDACLRSSLPTRSFDAGDESTVVWCVECLADALLDEERKRSAAAPVREHSWEPMGPVAAAVPHVRWRCTVCGVTGVSSSESSPPVWPDDAEQCAAPAPVEDGEAGCSCSGPNRPNVSCEVADIAEECRRVAAEDHADGFDWQAAHRRDLLAVASRLDALNAAPAPEGPVLSPDMLRDIREVAEEWRNRCGATGREFSACDFLLSVLDHAEAVAACPRCGGTGEEDADSTGYAENIQECPKCGGAGTTDDTLPSVDELTVALYEASIANPDNANPTEHDAGVLRHRYQAEMVRQRLEANRG